MPAFVDHYRVLGVSPSASEAEIRHAFRRAVHRHHADRHPHDAAASERMRAIVAARDVLCDLKARARFDLARAGRVHLAIYDVRGRHVATVLDAERAAGRHAASWSGRDAAGRTVANGVYFAELRTADGVVSSRRVVLLR